MQCAARAIPAARTLGGLGLALLVPVLAGCGPGTGKVSGQVTYKGRPVPGATVLFRPADPGKDAVIVQSDTDGRYSAILPTGEVQVLVDNRDLEPAPAGPPSVPLGIPLAPEVRAKLGGKAAPPPPPAEGEPKTAEDSRRPSGRYVPIPAKYYTLETSGLKFTVRGGDQPHDIELTD